MPAFIHGPVLREGESRLQFLVRHHPQEWDNFVAYIRKELGVSTRICDQLRTLNTQNVDDPIVISQCEQWVNHRLPCHYRTLKSLSDLRELMRDTTLNWSGMELTQILCPRERNPTGDSSAERMFSEMGAEVMSLDAGSNREMDYAEILPRVKGRYLWLVPGGSRFMAPLVAMSLQRVFSQMESDSSMAVYFDGSYSLIYRVSALKEATAKAGSMRLNQENTTRILQQASYSCCGDHDPDCALCEIEAIYGGNYPFPRPVGRQSWLRRLFDR